MITNEALEPWLKKLGFHERKEPDLYFSHSFPSDHPYSFYLRGLKDLGIDAVYCIDNSPVILFKTLETLEDKDKLKELHKTLWNQSLAPVIVLSTSHELRVYSGINKPANEQEDLDKGNRFVRSITITDSFEEFKELHVNKFESGEFFRTFHSNFDPEQRVDRYLLKQLGKVRGALINEGLSDDIAYTLLGRSIFITYLYDRKVLLEDYFKDFNVNNYIELISLLNLDLLFKFFNKLKEDFNGDIFPMKVESINDQLSAIEQKQIKSTHLALLLEFLQGTDMEGGQLRFWPYNFKYIPVEMISGVYEQFLGGDKKSKKQTGSYYTPRFLADIVINTAFADKKMVDGIKVLDPSCGSGIFLVGAYRRIVESKMAINNRKPTAKTLIKTLTESIWGVDINRVACQIASFSLYLTMLDYLEPRDIIELKDKGLKLPILVGRNLIEADFFSDKCPLAINEFDLIIGNPPWRSAEGNPHEFEKWCEIRSYPIADRNIAQAFVWKSETHMNKDGNITLLLPTGLLFNHSSKYVTFKKSWFNNFKIEKIINLTDLRHYLFSDAIGPGIIVKHKNKGSNLKNPIEYISPKTEPTWLNVELLPLSPDDYKFISPDSFKRDSLIWKKAFWGTNRDIKLIQRLESYKSIAAVVDEKNLSIGQGYKRGGGKPMKYSQLIGKKEIVNLTPYVIPDSSTRIMTESDVRLHRHGVFEVYNPPHLLVSRGVSAKYGNKKTVSAFSYDYLIFKNSITAISGQDNDIDLLKLLSIVLNSNLASYFFFHTTANYGVWHDEVHIDELKRFPFPLNKANNDLIEEAVTFLDCLEKQKNKLLHSDTYFREVDDKIETLVYKFYDLTDDEKFLVEDTVNLIIPNTQPSRKSKKSHRLLQACNDNDLFSYLSILLNTLNDWIEGRSTKVIGKIIKSDLPLSIAKLTITNGKAGRLSNDNDESIADIIRKVYRFLPRKVSRNLYMLRNLRIFDKEDLYIIKPNRIKEWTRTSALNDADSIFYDIEKGVVKLTQ